MANETSRANPTSNPFQNNDSDYKDEGYHEVREASKNIKPGEDPTSPNQENAHIASLINATQYILKAKDIPFLSYEEWSQDKQDMKDKKEPTKEDYAQYLLSLKPPRDQS